MTSLDDMTLPELKNYCRDLLRQGGGPCPCCTQNMKVYQNKVDHHMARTLILLSKTPSEFVHAPSLPGDTHKVSQLSWWGLVEEEKILREDGGRAGYWRITAHGLSWVRGEVSIPKYAKVYDGNCFHTVGDPTTIRQALGSKFDYRELMAL